MPRQITLNEMKLVKELGEHTDSIIRFVQNNLASDGFAEEQYEAGIDALIALARPEFTPSPTAPQPLGESGETAAAPASRSNALGHNDATRSSGGLITDEGLLDALISFQHDTFGRSTDESWARQIHTHILKHASAQQEIEAGDRAA
jgi:hypothetical protein